MADAEVKIFNFYGMTWREPEPRRAHLMVGNASANVCFVAAFTSRPASPPSISACYNKTAGSQRNVISDAKYRHRYLFTITNASLTVASSRRPADQPSHRAKLNQVLTGSFPESRPRGVRRLSCCLGFVGFGVRAVVCCRGMVGPLAWFRPPGLGSKKTGDRAPAGRGRALDPRNLRYPHPSGDTNQTPAGCGRTLVPCALRRPHPKGAKPSPRPSQGCGRRPRPCAGLSALATLRCSC